MLSVNPKILKLLIQLFFRNKKFRNENLLEVLLCLSWWTWDIESEPWSLENKSHKNVCCEWIYLNSFKQGKWPFAAGHWESFGLSPPLILYSLPISPNGVNSVSELNVQFWECRQQIGTSRMSMSMSRLHGRFNWVWRLFFPESVDAPIWVFEPHFDSGFDPYRTRCVTPLKTVVYF